MNKIIVVFLSLGLCACTSFYPVSATNGDIQNEVRAGTSVKVGDRIRIKMKDAAEHELVVTDLTADTIVGEKAEIPIDDIVSIDIRETSAGKTTGLVVGIMIVVGSLVAAIDLGQDLTDALID